MNILDLRSQIESLAWGPRGSADLQMATASPSPVTVVCAAFSELSKRPDRTDGETELLRACCQMIRTNQWYGLAVEAVTVEQSLPPPPVPLGLPTSIPEPESI